MNRFLILCTFIVLIPHITNAKTNSKVRKEFERFESYALPNTQIRKIHSEFTKQNYRIYVNIPSTYFDNPSKQYPSLFMLDADYSFALAKQTSEHLSDRNHVPEMFVFGIAYDGPLNYRMNRTRDYTPTHVPDGGYGPEFQKQSGGGPAFAQFLEEELVPYLQKEFRISNQRVLVGHSYGGLFTSWMMVTRPSVFSGYISVSPSLWYDNGKIFDLINKGQSKNLTRTSVCAFFGIGAKENSGDHRMVDNMNRFVKSLREGDRGSGAIGSFVFADENHDTVFPAALTRGIMHVFGNAKKS